MPSPTSPPACATHRKRAGSDASDSREGANGKRIRVVTQACKDCRRNKAKCDGKRPKCGPCVHKGRECGYEGEVGQSRQAAMRTRLETLEKLFERLKTRPPEDAGRLLHRIRANDELSSAAQSLEGDAATPAEYAVGGPPDQSTSPAESAASGRHCGRDCHHQDYSVVSESLPTLSSGVSTLSSATSSTSSQRGYRDRHEASPLLVRLDLPDQVITRRAVEAFYASTGSLFHVFSHAQAREYLDQMYASGPQATPSSVKKAACCVTSVAAIGVQYRADAFEDGVDATFHDFARHCFVDVLEDRPLDSIKVCTLLAMYNIMNKATVSVAYVEVGLGMTKRQGVNGKHYIYPGLTSEESREYRTAWKCLIFFSTWLSSTLGYLSSEDMPLNTLLPLVEADPGTSVDIIETVQVEMTKISMLKADILRMHLAFKDLTDLAMESIMDDLQDWYHRLPPAMSLATLGQSDIPEGVRRSIYYVHLFYLGAIMLLYRRVASQFNRTQSAVPDHRARKRFEQLMLDHAEQGVLAAHTSSRILNLLLGQGGCFARCWVIIFQSYTSCVVLLHCVAQKQLHNFPRSSWEEDLPQAKACLDTIGHCSTLDPVALQFHERLSPIYEALKRHVPSPNYPPHPSFSSSSSPSSGVSSSTSPPDAAGAGGYDPVRSPHPFAFLLTTPPARDGGSGGGGDPACLALSARLLHMLSRPYDNPSDSESVRDGYGLDTTHWNEKRLALGAERDGMEWEVRHVKQYRWDTRRLGIPDGVLGEAGRRTVVEAGLLDGGRWLGSETPSGWKTVL